MTRGRRVRGGVALVLAAALSLLGACGGGGDEGGGSAAGKKLCDPSALTSAAKPVTVTFWHTQTSENEVALKKLADRFNASQSDVKVQLVYIPTYPELLSKFKAGLTSGDLPDAATFEETTVQTLIDSKAMIPVQACVDASNYALSDFVPSTLAYYTVDDTLWSMPWNVSNPVLFYDKARFAKAGLDPNKPPATLAEVKADAQKIVASGAAPHGMALRTQDFYNEFWYAKAGQSYVNNSGGRASRATKATLENDTGRQLWTWWKDMVDSGLAINTGSQPNNTDHLLAVANGQAAMTIESTPAIGPVYSILGSGQFPGVEMAVAPMPGLKATGGVPVGDGSIWLSKHSSAAKVAAAWKWIQFLVAPEQVAEYHVATGVVPVRQSAVTSESVQKFWAEKPAFRVGYDQLMVPGGPAARGSVIGDYQGVRDAVRDALTAMLTQGMPVDTALHQAQVKADAAIKAYNERVGAG